MARAARQKPASTADAAAAAEAMATSIHRWTGYLSDVPELPSSWPIDWRPDGTKPCRACGNRRWWQRVTGEGWCCTTCHPPSGCRPAAEAPAQQKEAA